MSARSEHHIRRRGVVAKALAVCDCIPLGYDDPMRIASEVLGALRSQGWDVFERTTRGDAVQPPANEETAP